MSSIEHDVIDHTGVPGVGGGLSAPPLPRQRRLALTQAQSDVLEWVASAKADMNVLAAAIYPIGVTPPATGGVAIYALIYTP